MRRFFVWSALAALIGLILAIGGFWAYQHFYARFQPVTVTRNQGEIQDLLDEASWLSSGGGGEPLYIIGYRDSAAMQRYEREEAPKLRAAGLDWLQQVEIDPARIDDLPRTFSGGMQQRLQIARNLVSSPKLVFMDEPTGGLDVSVQARLLDLLRGLVRELDLAVVIVTHDLAVARLLADRLMVMRRSRVVESGLTDQILDDPQHPYTQLLVSSVLQP